MRDQIYPTGRPWRKRDPGDIMIWFPWIPPFVLQYPKLLFSGQIARTDITATWPRNRLTCELGRQLVSAFSAGATLVCLWHALLATHRSSCQDICRRGIETT